tara:strand:- start:1034 stop:1693 length:660 start_codon:yes stop_codon:yes gene_type:complete
MATIDDLVNAQAYRRAAMAEGLAMGREIPPGKGGSPGQPYEPDEKGPFVPAPPRDGLMIAHHREHFGDGGGDDLMKKLMADPTLNESDFQRILGPDYKKKIQQYQQNQSMLISGAQDLDSKTNPLQDGTFLDEDGNRYLWSPREQKFLDMGPYDPDVHGLPIPLAKKNNMMIASHDNRPFKSVPATGPSSDTMAPDWLIDYMNRKDENLFQIQDRLKRV